MEVRIVKEFSLETVSEPDYVRVHVCPDPSDDTVMLATIERITAFGSREAALRKKAPCQVRPLVVNQRMSEEDALALARRYAEHKNISVIFADHG